MESHSAIQTGDVVTTDGLKHYEVADADYEWGLNHSGVLLESLEDYDKGDQIKKTDLQMSVHWRVVR